MMMGSKAKKVGAMTPKSFLKNSNTFFGEHLWKINTIN
jgi:hypothetical protein